MQLEHADSSLWRRAVEHGQRVGWTADHLTFHQKRLIGQYEQGSAFIYTSDWQLLALWQVDTFDLQQRNAKHLVRKPQYIKKYVEHVQYDIHINILSRSFENKKVMCTMVQWWYLMITPWYFHVSVILKI